MISVYLNDVALEAEDSCFLEAFLTQQGVLQECCVVAVNALFVSRQHYAVTRLQHQDRVDLIIPMQGG